MRYDITMTNNKKNIYSNNFILSLEVINNLYKYNVFDIFPEAEKYDVDYGKSNQRLIKIYFDNNILYIIYIINKKLTFYKEYNANFIKYINDKIITINHTYNLLHLQTYLIFKNISEYYSLIYCFTNLLAISGIMNIYKLNELII